jgi:hypothetical protein
MFVLNWYDYNPEPLIKSLAHRINYIITEDILEELLASLRIYLHQQHTEEYGVLIGYHEAFAILINHKERIIGEIFQ